MIKNTNIKLGRFRLCTIVYVLYFIIETNLEWVECLSALLLFVITINMWVHRSITRAYKCITDFITNIVRQGLLFYLKDWRKLINVIKSVSSILYLFAAKWWIYYTFRKKYAINCSLCNTLWYWIVNICIAENNYNRKQ